VSRKAPPGWYPRRGEVYLARLDKPRPALVISVDALNQHALDVCIVPLSTVEHRKFSSMRLPLKAGEGGLRFASWAKCDQVTTLEKTSLKYPPLGTIPVAALRAVEQRIKLALGLI